MAKQYVHLEQTTLKNDAIMAHPLALPKVIHLDDPATDVMIDFSRHKCMHVQVSDKFDYIYHSINISHTAHLLVLDDNRMLGIISAKDLHGAKPIQITQNRGIQREEITAPMLATSCDDMIVFDYHELEHARVGNIVESFNYYKKHFALVVEKASDMPQQLIFNDHDHPQADQQIIRGLIIEDKIKAQLYI
ncbi:MAG: hypothetical protein AAGA27_07180 [Pseudomonadota bacterium]